MKNKVDGPSDCLATEMLQNLPMESVYGTTHCFEKRFKGGVQSSRGLEHPAPGISQKTDARLETCLREFRAIAVLSREMSQL